MSNQDRDANNKGNKRKLEQGFVNNINNFTTEKKVHIYFSEGQKIR